MKYLVSVGPASPAVIAEVHGNSYADKVSRIITGKESGVQEQI